MSVCCSETLSVGTHAVYSLAGARAHDDTINGDYVIICMRTSPADE